MRTFLPKLLQNLRHMKLDMQVIQDFKVFFQTSSVGQQEKPGWNGNFGKYKGGRNWMA